MFDVFYINSPTKLWPHEKQVNSLEEACALSRTRYLWVVDGHNDYSDFDWLWEPVPWEAHQTHVWPSQHQDNGQTYLIPKIGVGEINRNHEKVTRKQSVPVIGIDHGNGISIDVDIKTRYISDYLGTLRRVLSKVNDPYVWVVSSVCDYTDFDFTWHPSEWQQDMLHVFPSNNQKFGDTFYIHIPTFLEKTEKLALLEWFDTIHFVEDITVPRLPVPIVTHSYDTQVKAIWEHTFQDPVVEFVCETGAVGERVVPTLNLWRTEMKTVMPLSKGASSVVVPREVKNFIKTQVYDYPHIDKTSNNIAYDQPLDIVFIDNGEKHADYNYQMVFNSAKNYTNKILRSSGVNGRVAAYQAAAMKSTTPWFFAVFAKLRVSDEFNWYWQPDRLQAPKHYIFHAFNPINGLEYGHQAMIAYNKELVLNNPGVGLDFTLDSEHEVVPIRSGTAEYADTRWSAWRTAFREVIKLKCNTDVESQYRLNKWLTVAMGLPFGQYSIYGAEDAVEYYDAVNGDFDALKKSYDWEWLASYALIKRNLSPGQ